MFAGILAILVALAGAYTVRQLLQKPAEPVAAPTVPTVDIPVASIDLAAGKTIASGDINILRMTREQAANHKPALPEIYMTNAEQIVGRILKVDIVKGQAFDSALFYPSGTGPSVADDLPAGLRAVTISVNASGLVDGHAMPGTIVDVLFRLDIPGDNRPATSTAYTILEAVKVLAVDRASFPGSQTAGAGDGSAKVRVTLAVTPEQASQLKVVESRGELFLSLRSPNEKSAGLVQADLDKVKAELDVMNKEAKALRDIIRAAADIGTEFDDQGRLEKLNAKIIEREKDVARLERELLAVASAPTMRTFEEVLQMKRELPSIADKLPAGMRAVTVFVKGAGYLDGFAQPGTFVDVLFRLPQLSGHQDYQETTFSVLEGVEIMAVNRSTDPMSAVTPVSASNSELPVTLAVTPDQASKLKVIEGRGELSLVLRSPQEQHKSVLEAKMDDLSLQLEELKIEEEALRQIEEIAKRRGVPFKEKERLQEVALLIRVREKELNGFEAKLATAQESPKQSTLAGVLGIPDPPTPPPPTTPAPPRQIEVYRGGSRQTVTFGT